MGDFWESLYGLVVGLRHRWGLYRALFGQSQERVDILNKNNAYVFGMIQDLLEESVLVEVAKLLDPAKTGRGSKATPNLCLESGILELQLPTSDKLFGELGRRLDQIRSKAEPIRKRRNKVLAHNDKAVLLGQELLAGVSVQLVEEVLAETQEFCNKLTLPGAGFMLTELPPEQPYEQVKALVQVLQRGNSEATST